MEILKKINYGICGVLVFIVVLSFLFRFDPTPAYLVGLLLIGEFIYMASEQVKSENEKITEFLDYSKTLYSLDFSNLHYIQDIRINSDRTFTVFLYNQLFFTYHISLLPISQKGLNDLDLKFDNLKIKDNTK